MRKINWGEIKVAYHTPKIEKNPCILTFYPNMKTWWEETFY